MHINTSQRFGIALSVLVSFFLVSFLPGCGNDYGIDLIPVTGTVSLDGQPLETGKVEFRPSEKDRSKMAPRGSTGFTNDSGKYELYFLNAKGCPVGDYEVVISSAAKNGRPLKLDQESKLQLSAEVTADGDGVFDFQLSSLKKRR